ncbi:MAG: hypothetical protein HeimC3_35740 [Candidatus Heimdallarchaeota archaeon LC_3]|nr:MAG: hypothetical protein HeimC3_35740 [Candidatus Heimdallarchaeota archaeon LC_3]
MTLTIKSLSKDEYTFLQKVYENDSRKKVRKRANIILFYLNGLSFIDILKNFIVQIRLFISGLINGIKEELEV